MTTQIEWKKAHNNNTHTRKIAVKKEEQNKPTNVRDFTKIKCRSNNIGRSAFWIEILIHVVIVFFAAAAAAAVIDGERPNR